MNQRCDVNMTPEPSASHGRAQGPPLHGPRCTTLSGGNNCGRLRWRWRVGHARPLRDQSVLRTWHVARSTCHFLWPSSLPHLSLPHAAPSTWHLAFPVPNLLTIAHDYGPITRLTRGGRPLLSSLRIEIRKKEGVPIEPARSNDRESVLSAHWRCLSIQ